MKKATPIRINLGCGRDYKEGYINVDIVTDFPVDVVADLSKPLPFKDNYADEIFASDILEHFTKEDGEVFLKECFRVLKVGGVCIIRTHNLDQIITQFKDDPWVMKHFIYGNTEHTGVWGAHKYAYGKEELEMILAYIGFGKVNIVREETNFLVHAVKEKTKEKKFTIGIIHQTPGMGGAETNIINLSKYFIQEKQRVFFATNFPGLLKKVGFVTKVQKVPYILDVIGDWKGLVKTILLLPAAFFFYFRLLSAWKKEGVSCLLMSGFSEKMLVSILSLWFRIPVFWIEYADLRPIFSHNIYLPYILYRLCLRIPKKVVVPGDYTKQALIQHAKVPLSKQVDIPPGVSQKQVGKKKHTGFRIGNISRLVPEKGQDILIRAMSMVVKKVPEAHLSIVGEGMDPKVYQELIKKLHLENHVELLGYVPVLDEFYKNLDVFVFPTVWTLEGFGMVATEAMHQKVPVIVSNLGTLPEIVDYGNAGMLVTPGDPDEIADAIIALYKNSALRKKIAEAGYGRMRKLYTIDVTGNQFLTLFKKELALKYPENFSS